MKHVPENEKRCAYACVCFREAPDEDAPMVDEEAGQVAPMAAGLAAVERLQRAARQDDPPASQGLPSPPKRPFKSPGVSSLCALATSATLRLMTGTEFMILYFSLDAFSEKLQ